MSPLVINDFCAGQNFKRSIINILTPNIFSPQANLNVIYNDMTNNINNNIIVSGKKNIIKLYPLCGKHINNNLNKKTITPNNFVYAGHDLPVWRNDPDQAKKRIMVITQDPRRSYDEMNANGMSPTSDWIGISTPFGLHSLTYRSHKTKGLVHYLFNALQDELQKKYNYNPNDLSIYYTDVYKFRGVAPAKNSNTPNDVIDKPNMKIYAVVLRSEINLYKPDVIILMGKEAQNAWNSISATISSNIPILSTPHPSPQANSKWKAKYPKTSSFTACDKIDLILKELIPKLIP